MFSEEFNQMLFARASKQIRAVYNIIIPLLPTTALDAHAALRGRM